MTKYNPVYEAYKILVAIRDNDSATYNEIDPAIEEAIGYLGEALDDHPEVE